METLGENLHAWPKQLLGNLHPTGDLKFLAYIGFVVEWGHDMRIAILLGIGLIGVGASVQAQSLTISSSSRSTLLNSQMDVLDNRASSQYSNSILLQPPRAIIPGTPEAIARGGFVDSPYLSPARAAAKGSGIPEDLFLRLVQQESGWNAQAISPKGAIGLAQLMPPTARLLKVDPRNPSQNLQGGARYLRMMYDKFGSWRLALAAYNAGPEAVEKYKGIPPYAETQKYVVAILGR